MFDALCLVVQSFFAMVSKLISGRCLQKKGAVWTKIASLGPSSLELRQTKVPAEPSAP